MQYWFGFEQLKTKKCNDRIPAQEAKGLLPLPLRMELVSVRNAVHVEIVPNKAMDVTLFAFVFKMLIQRLVVHQICILAEYMFVIVSLMTQLISY